MSLRFQSIVKMNGILFYFQSWVLSTMLEGANVLINSDLICFIV